ncbi:UDP-N-acetylglucosamine 2-epimerase (hydrolyzing) [Campylobacter sp. faydin G-24]|uniref:UDP-N-acetylglucosamine 2-epimerase (Hydrolyzing) n=1 Tax=Campylobacter anatolicus TaxID=2829105 RepID=A0ABS5HHH3_9BACT|nr:UDP-N-acetylglucosamine 2-epimerase [Campylobacter anatolicus]MBR8462162.1 UDP-N-acetylglucosamine 2-epimerase (hydrolyzing) [Campylobacter anatolicus]MBR8463721.1 UDP-N-acetylglucosamine 2-epimerase (hydrolyzing) [Campylobacter anatolicus]
MKKLLFITGTRADFGKIKSFLNYIEKNDNFELHLIITGMHMLETYGGTYREVLLQNYKNIYLLNNQFINEPMDSVIGNSISVFSRVFSQVNPDMVFVHGDRLEALAGAICAAFSNRLICHIEGGEVSGTIDESIRHAITKFAHFHLVANDKAKERVLKMGESEDSVFIIGSADLDIMSNDDLPSLELVKRIYDIKFDDYAISLFHPVTTEVDCIKNYAKEYFDALKISKQNYIVIYPNNDNGSHFIIDAINNIKSDNIKIYPSIRFERFLTLLKNAKFIIGNSSAGIREAPFYGIGTINVGTRQQGRFSYESIINCGYDKCQILQAIKNIKSVGKFKPSPYFKGNSNSIEEFKKFINNHLIWQTDTQKRFVE